MALPFIEQYRPNTFGEIVGVEDMDRIVDLLKSPEDMPNLLFHGPAGTGKTTISRVILKQLEPVDVLRLNGSAKKDRSIEAISERLVSFATSMSSQPDKPKIIFIDEMDNLTSDAFLSLRGEMEKIVKNARIIGTCNYINKVPDAVKSRFALFEFKKTKDKFLYARCRDICDMEGITIQEDTLNVIVKKANGDIRTALNMIQMLSANEIKNISALDVENFKTQHEEIYKLLVEGKWESLRTQLPDMDVDMRQSLVEIENLFFNSSYDVTVKSKITEIISQGLVDIEVSFNDEICFSSICSKIIESLP